MDTLDTSRETPAVALEPNVWEETYKIRTYEVDWVVESVPSSLLKTSAPTQLEINFLAEAFFEDCILAACHPQDPDNTVFHHSLIRQQDGRELARAKSVWRPF
jgi:hypothetical protein